jgi:hypothetical protein
MTFGDSIVDGNGIIRAVRAQRRNFRVDLIKQRPYFGGVPDIVRRQLRGKDLMRDGVNPKVQLAPPAARPDAMCQSALNIDPLLDCAPWSGQDQAAVLTVCRAC